MIAKSRADFINSIVYGQETVCPTCGTKNNADSRFCVSCGTEIEKAVSNNNIPAFAPTSNSEDAKKIVKYVEPSKVFAEGLPDWDIVPPQVVVRRH